MDKVDEAVGCDASTPFTRSTCSPNNGGMVKKAKSVKAKKPHLITVSCRLTRDLADWIAAQAARERRPVSQWLHIQLEAMREAAEQKERRL